MKGSWFFRFLAGALAIFARRGRNKFGRGFMYAYTGGHHLCEYPGCPVIADHWLTKSSGKPLWLCCQHNDSMMESFHAAR